MQIIDTANSIGYSFQKQGVCYGIAYIALQTELEGGVDALTRLHTRFNLISSCPSVKAFKYEYNVAKDKHKKREHLSEEHYLLATMDHFFDGIAMYMGRGALDKSVADEIQYPRDQSYEYAANLFGANQNIKRQLKSKGILRFEKEDLTDFFIDENSCYIFKPTNHCFFVSHNNGRWFIADHDNVFFCNKKHLIDYINKKYITQGVRSFAIEKYNGSLISDVAQKKSISSAVENSDNEYLYLALISDNKYLIDSIMTHANKFSSSSNKHILFSAKNKYGLSGFNIALASGFTSVVKEYIDHVLTSELTNEQKVDLILAKDNNNIHGFLHALINGHTSTISEYINSILHSNLNNIQKLQLLSVKDSSNRNALKSALLNGHEQVVQKYINQILYSNLSDESKEELLKNCPKKNIEQPYHDYILQTYPIKLFTSLQHGDYEAVSIIFKNLNSIPFSTEELINILNTVSSDKIPGLYWALYKGYASTIKEYMTGINRLKIPDKIKYYLYISLDENNTPGLYSALINGHTDAVKEFINGVLESGLGTDYITNILLAKNKYGEPGAYRAFINGKKETMLAYINTIKNSSLPVQIKNKILSSSLELIEESSQQSLIKKLHVFLKQGDTAKLKALLNHLQNSELSDIEKAKLLDLTPERSLPGLFWSLYNGHSDTVNECSKYIINLNIPSVIKRNLLLANDENNTPGLYWSLINNHTETVKNFTNNILNSDLDEHDIIKILTPTNSSGDSGLVIALQKLHKETVKEFVSLIEHSNLSDDAKIKILKGVDLSESKLSKKY